MNLAENGAPPGLEHRKDGCASVLKGSPSGRGAAKAPRGFCVGVDAYASCLQRMAVPTATRNRSELRNAGRRLLVAAAPRSVACWHCKHEARTTVSGPGEYCTTAVDIGHERAARARMCVCGRCLRKVSSRACNSLCARRASAGASHSAPAKLTLRTAPCSAAARSHRSSMGGSWEAGLALCDLFPGTAPCRRAELRIPLDVASPQ
jgi:hypothetical protein